MKKKKEIIGAIIVWALIIILGVGNVGLDLYLYDDNHCIKCNTEYKPMGAYGNKTSRGYILKCPSCGFNFSKNVYF